MNSIVVPGRQNLSFKLLEESDYQKLQEFCDYCKNAGIKNNESFEAIKLEQMKMPYGQFFIGYDTDQDVIWTILGVHHLPEIHNHAWRVFFRGAQLPNYRLGNGLSKDFFKVGFQITYMLEMQIKFILEHDPSAEFYASTNTPLAKAFARSQYLDQIMLPMLVKRGIFTKEYDNFVLFYTLQSIWKLNVDKYFEEREKSVGF